MNRDETVGFRDAIVRRLGLYFEDAKLEVLAELLQKRAQATSMPPTSYVSWLTHAAPADEVSLLAQDLTVGETYFFRNREQFDALAGVVVPERTRAAHDSKVFRALSAGCASGEEAYSLAIVIGEALPDPSWSVQVRGIDLNPTAIERAQKARYTSWSMRETPEGVQRRWFHAEGKELVLDAGARSRVRFEQRNLADEDTWRGTDHTYDVIFCRNVLMYFAPDVARIVVAHLERALVPGGHLFLGHAETLRGLSQEFHLRHTHGTFYYQTRGGEPHGEVTVSPPPSVVAAAAPTLDWASTIHGASERIHALASQPAFAAGRAQHDIRAAWELLREERYADALAALPGDDNVDTDQLLLRAVLLAHSGQLAEAEATSKRLVAIDELSAGAHYVMALCRDHAGDRAAAADHDEVAVYLDPSFAMPRLHLGLLARRAGDFATARRELAQALLLLQREDASRLLLFGGGFHREALVRLCRTELTLAEGS
jgi:chemotaxis protein methyltransferase CheR